MEGSEREGPKLLLNQGPSEPCYATDILALVLAILALRFVALSWTRMSDSLLETLVYLK